MIIYGRSTTLDYNSCINLYSLSDDDRNISFLPECQDRPLQFESISLCVLWICVRFPPHFSGSPFVHLEHYREHLFYFNDHFYLFDLLLGAVILLRIVDCAARWNYNFTTPLSAPLTTENRTFFYIFQLAVRGEFTIATGWLAYASLSTYHKQKNIEPWIKKRYSFLGVGALVYLL